MTHAHPNRRFGRRAAGVRPRAVALALLPVFAAPLLAAPAGADAARLLAERVEAGAVLAHCELASPGARAALEAGRLQARGALVRAGADPDALDRYEAAARARGRAAACDDAAVTELAARALDAYAGWRSLRSLDFPAETRTWAAARALTLHEGGWALHQEAPETSAAPAIGFGLIRTLSGVVLVAAPVGDRPRAARLYIRDPGRAPDPPDRDLARLWTPRDADPLALAAAPDALTKVVWADAVEGPTPERPFGLARFPTRVLEQLARLGPAETFAVELELAKAGTVRAYFEAGDLGAALAFVGPVTEEPAVF